MSEAEKNENKEVSFKDNETIVSLLKEMVLKLDAMEKKVDALSRESKHKAFKDKPFSKPRGAYDKHKSPRGRRPEGKKETPSSEGKFYHGLPFAKKKAGGKGRYAGGKKRHSKA